MMSTESGKPRLSLQTILAEGEKMQNSSLCLRPLRVSTLMTHTLGSVTTLRQANADGVPVCT